MKKLILLAISQILFCSILIAQTDNPGCSLHVTLKDATCQPPASCNSPGSCLTVQFSVTEGCPTHLWLKAYTKCGPLSQCPHCASCVKIYESGGTVVATISSASACLSGTCCATIVWDATPGTYTMQVCLVPCDNDVDGQACCASANLCEAWGELSQGTLSCP